jgi:aminoglycoside phosphotransferase (APT) family kinase protein
VTGAETLDRQTAEIDPTRPMREGEELDTAKVAAFLRANVEGIDPEARVSVEQFPGGHSNLTYLVRAGDRELVLRRPPFGNRVKTAHDMGREYKILSKLSARNTGKIHGVYPPAPRPLAYTEDTEVLGAPFYVMERIRGTILRRTLPESIRLEASSVRRLCEAFVDNLAALHAIDYQAAGLGEIGKPAGYIERQVTGWTKRYRDARTDDIPAMEVAAAWLHERMGEAGKDVRASVIHNDYKYDNLVLDLEQDPNIRGVLDWEMATVGDPLMDLGTALGYWIDPTDTDEEKTFAFGPTLLPGSMTRQELAHRYAAATGRDVSNILFFFVFALFKTAGVAQQIYARYHQGLTKDPRFAAFIVGTRVLAGAAVHATERGSI